MKLWMLAIVTVFAWIAVIFAYQPPTTKIPPCALYDVKASTYPEYRDLPEHTITVRLAVGAESAEVAVGALQGAVRLLENKPLAMSPDVSSGDKTNHPAVVMQVLSVYAEPNEGR